MDKGIDRIDDVIHGRLRMGIMAYLANAEAATFTELKDNLGATQGNLSVQIRKLEEAEYLSVDKRIVDRKPLTTVRITREGREAFAAYLTALTDVLGLAKRP
jgi:DNA-binding MarR family transcriptional regulator